MDDIGESLYLARGYAWQIAWQDANQLDYLAKAEFYTLVTRVPLHPKVMLCSRRWNPMRRCHTLLFQLQFLG